ncbi:hypothetical protein P4056_11830 [Pseudomonas aeruginosa]|nr:hypothetical protein [Pseudomonas aeruginosa]
MTWVWRDALRDAGELSQLLHGASERYQPLDDDTRRAAQVRQNVQAWWQLVSQAPRWRFTSLAFPSSWFSSWMHVSTTRIAAFPSACWCDRCAACWKARRATCGRSAAMANPA